MDIKLTEAEQAKYDKVYSQITGKYCKEDLELLENDDVAKFVLKNLIIRYVLTGEMSSNRALLYAGEIYFLACATLKLRKFKTISPVYNNPL